MTETVQMSMVRLVTCAHPFHTQAPTRSVQPEVERLAGAPNGLTLLADWIDVKYPHDANPQVQRDLREWASAIRALLDARTEGWSTYEEVEP